MRRVALILVISSRLALYLVALAIVVATRSGHHRHGPIVRLPPPSSLDSVHPDWLFGALIGFLGLGIVLELVSGAGRWR